MSYAGFPTQAEANAHLDSSTGVLQVTATEYIPNNPASSITLDPCIGHNNELYSHPLQSEPQLTKAFAPRRLWGSRLGQTPW